MTCRKKITRKADKICTGDLDQRIKIQTRTKLANNDGAAEADLLISNFVDVWTMQQSTNGEEAFDSTNTIKVITDRFYIRYRKDIDITNAILKSEGGDSIRFKIIDIENINGRNEFLLIRASRRGDGTLKNNFL
jgi:head-tail adaptor